MTLYKPEDIELLENNWSNIMTDVENERFALLEPTLDEMKEVHSVILDFVKANKRKVYGGFALNLLIKNKDKKRAIYKDNKIPDIDFYSTEPIVDLIKLCNILHEKKYKFVVGREAMHQETYSVTVNYMIYCDISYVPKNIYHKMPFIDIEDIRVIHPHFMYIDYLRMLSDPLISYWRFDDDLKSFRRFYLLQEFYPFPEAKSEMQIKKCNPTIQTALDMIFQFSINKTSIMTIGLYAYNYYIYESKITEKNSNISMINVPYYEFISADYRNDFLALKAHLKTNVVIPEDRLTYTEFYPFFQFTGHSVELYIDNQLICRMYNNNKKCFPYLDFPAIRFNVENNSVEKHKKYIIRLGTYQMTLLYGIISIMRARTNDNASEKNLYYQFVRNLIDARNNFFDVMDKNYLDNTPFKEFVVKCIGETIQPDRQRRLLIESRKKKNKRYVFSYEPSDGVKEPTTNYEFANSSGNRINNPKNLRLSESIHEDDPEGDFEDDTTNSN